MNTLQEQFNHIINELFKGLDIPTKEITARQEQNTTIENITFYIDNGYVTIEHSNNKWFISYSSQHLEIMSGEDWTTYENLHLPALRDLINKYSKG